VKISGTIRLVMMSCVARAVIAAFICGIFGRSRLGLRDLWSRAAVRPPITCAGEELGLIAAAGKSARPIVPLLHNQTSRNSGGVQTPTWPAANSQIFLFSALSTNVGCCLMNRHASLSISIVLDAQPTVLCRGSDRRRGIEECGVAIISLNFFPSGDKPVRESCPEESRISVSRTT
jgi:hypothetical protein